VTVDQPLAGTALMTQWPFFILNELQQPLQVTYHGPAMNRTRRLKATFSGGSVGYLSTEKAFTHAWRITGLLRATKPGEIRGWARSEALAQQAVAHQARSVAKDWRDVKAEVVEIEAA
jgi:hypothetical protein